LYLTPLTLLHGIGASGSFRLKKQGQICKVKKTEANVHLKLKTRAEMQLALNKNIVNFLYIFLIILLN